ncbi:MAG: multicopper oxidase domain-containing protein [Methylococcaceae bacterium]|nr:multicopper oxidase domain-containing protein [Methylococcaceae bacterium]
MDTRDNKHELERTHSLHPHGIVFAPEHDGAYPLSPEDRNQPVDGEAALWSIPKLGVDGFKKSDRVPPGASFTYKWDTFSWPATAGVWLYHDHSICDHHNVGLGAIGFLVIHNSADEDDVLEQDLPSGDVNGALILNNKYVVPPQKAFYLQVYHEMRTEFDDRAMTINGRRWLGNTPTLIGGVDSKMRFGLIAMNDTTFHTFHLHGHRWVVPGPSGDKVGGEPPFGTGVQVSPLNKGVSQFEDTRIFGPANAFSFTINQGSFMGPPLGGGAKGEWHMHCHVLRHMMRGMMGSLLIVDQGDEATELPRGVKCPTDEDEDTGAAVTIVVDSFAFMPPEVTVSAGSEVTFHFKEEDHTVTTPLGGGIEINKGGGPDDPMDEDDKETVTISGNSGDEINYICGIHSFMKGKIRIT